jgi:hypothetical protein
MHRYTEIRNADGESLRRPAGVAMMETTDLRELDDLPVWR